jgi:hypothetical protein
MEWKAGDVAKALYDIYLEKFIPGSQRHTLEQVVYKDESYHVNDVAKVKCQVVIDIGITIDDSKLVLCHCSKCKPSHDVQAQFPGKTETYLLSSWFVNEKDTNAMIRALRQSAKDPNKHRIQILRYSPIEQGDPLISTKPKETEKIPVFMI